MGEEAEAATADPPAEELLLLLLPSAWSRWGWGLVVPVVGSRTAVAEGKNVVGRAVRAALPGGVAWWKPASRNMAGGGRKDVGANGAIRAYEGFC